MNFLARNLQQAFFEIPPPPPLPQDSHSFGAKKRIMAAAVIRGNIQYLFEMCVCPCISKYVMLSANL